MTTNDDAPRIVTGTARPPADLVASLAVFDTATVHESDPRGQIIDPMVGRTVTDRTVVGTAVTCLNRTGDNLMIHAAIEQCRPGDFLVVGVTSPGGYGVFGELLATQCRAQGIAGVLVDDAVRDTQAMRELGFPVWSRNVAVRGTTKIHQGWVNTPIGFGGATVNPGDVIVADGDAVLVVRREDVHDVVIRARARAERESGVRARFAAGELSIDVGGLRDRMPPTQAQQ